ncbi:MGH1-like glycoside hydrolase domain-containing protein [Pontibacter sp. G13]|uniref:MGH1-like glycoside hydrolase domain-containing protein n=1 Tax=Pontibacter sp. G13 TaxID=3074898 RepID=UPI002889BD01|nr:glucosidase [Pontibacter sp. G13]WNJ16414.1 glucosidase [Pontibacter sp. G13]
MATTEHQKLAAAKAGTEPWKKWGPYVSERQWGTVREDYSGDGNAWDFLPHDLARSKSYRWGEDGIAGISDEHQYLCIGWAFWNGVDPILKERLFGLSGPEGNHGEDVKEIYYYLDNSPSHSYMKYLYKYPQQPYPYSDLVDENGRRGRLDAEYELMDTGVFDEDRYFDLFIEYAKVGPSDILIQLEVCNRGPEDAAIHMLPTAWFRNRWQYKEDGYRPEMELDANGHLKIDHRRLKRLRLYAEEVDEWLFCENESNPERIGDTHHNYEFYKDGFHEHIIHGKPTVNPRQLGTKAAAWLNRTIPANSSQKFRFRLSPAELEQPFQDFEQNLNTCKSDADEFYEWLQRDLEDPELKMIQRQALAGMLWTKQYYGFDVRQWLGGDNHRPDPPQHRQHGRNAHWQHLNNSDIISMPDKWEYPWYAAWDLAFHCVSLALVDPDFAKSQLQLLTTEWYMHPNGQFPAYEWNFSDVNPPVQAWAAWQVFVLEHEVHGRDLDWDFLESVFHRYLMNFTWWVNRKDTSGNNIFEGGFLGLDNIGVFDRSSELPTGGHLEQSDGTSWMAMYSLNLMRMALALSTRNKTYEPLGTKFFEHFLYIAGAMVSIGQERSSLWDDADKFFYDVLQMPEGQEISLKVRSAVGLIPLFAVEVLTPRVFDLAPQFMARLQWFLDYRPDLAGLVSRWYEEGEGQSHLLSLLRGHRMKKLLLRMLDSDEFLSPYGVRGLSKAHEDEPYSFYVGDEEYRVAYTPGESDSGMFGGNSNWRGPVWFPLNYLWIESIRKFYDYYGPDFLVEYPTGSGKKIPLNEIADALSMRLIDLFRRNKDGKRPAFGPHEKFQTDPHFRDYLLFYEYFHGDTGAGLGASHQTGWSGLVANLIYQVGKAKGV